MKVFPRIPGLFLLIGLTVMVHGCLFNDFGAGKDELSSSTGTGPASVQFRLVIPDGSSERILPSISGALGSDTQVTVRLFVSNPGSSGSAGTAMIRSSVVGTDGSVSLTFSGLPLHPVLAHLRIDNGNLLGWSEFHGAIDLNPGNNILDLAPCGSKLGTDIIANVVSLILEQPELVLVATNQLVAGVRGVMTGLDTTDPSIYSKAFSNAVAALRPSGLVILAAASGSTSLAGTRDGSKIWEKTNSQLWQSGGLLGQDPSLMQVNTIFRPGFGAFGLVGWRHTSSGLTAISRLDPASGTLQAALTNPGPIRLAMVLKDGTILGGGFNSDKNAPVVFRWSGTASGSTFSTVAGLDTGLAWSQYFTQFPKTGQIPEPSVESIQFDGNLTLVVGVRDPGANVLRTFRVALSDGTTTALNSTGTPNMFPTVALTSPTDGAVFSFGTPISLSATASDADGSIARVEFYYGNSLIGSNTVSPYLINWTPASTGDLYLKACAIDQLGARGFSAPARITVNPTGNTPSIVSRNPASGAVTVPATSAVSVAFDLSMDASSITSSTFTLLKAGIAIPGSISTTDAKTWIITPTSTLDKSATYTVTVSGNVRTTGGMVLGTDVSWIFTTESAVQVLTLSAVADTSISSRDPDNNDGADTHVAAGRDGSLAGNPRRGLFRFDLSAIPSGVTVSSAILQIPVVGTPVSGSVNSNFSVYRLSQDWGEGNKGATSGGNGAPAASGEATWRSRKQGTALWTGLGAAGDYISSPSAVTGVSGVAVYTWSGSALLQDVRTWVANPSQNFGFILISDSEGTNRTVRKFGSREGSSPATLQVTFTP
ncbi:MAG: DNRLRE domain-containing protein [Candidatus Riflebacteria bacterium]|nr:DNRLRE domain-containing protein [Candidatus Riflebacteria bacterium]